MSKKEKNPITDYEISIIKRLLEEDKTQDGIPFKIGIYRFFQNNNKALNNGRIKEIKDNKGNLGLRASKINKADDDTISKFNNIINTGDLKTRLNSFIEEHRLIIKARESMIAAISSFNNPMFNFGVENFLVLSNIAWTALLQSIAQDNNISILNPKKSDKEHLSLNQLIYQIVQSKTKLLSKAMISNIELLIKIRDAITHSPNVNIPDYIASHLQSNCFNFNEILTMNYGVHRGLDNVFSIALQMANFKPLPQLKGLIGANSSNNFVHIKNIINDFEYNLDSSILENQEYKCSIAIVPMSVDKANKADYVYIVPPDSKAAKDIQNVVFKSQITIDKSKKYPHSFNEIKEILNNEGYKINKNTLITLNKKHDIKNKDKYAYQHHISTKNTPFTYSENYLDFLRKELKKFKVN